MGPERGEIMQNLISRKDAAEKLGISVKTLDQARINGLIAYVQFKENGCVYFTETAIEEYVAKCTHRAKPAEDVRTTYRKRRS
jgi:predicted site-specific integrase-resolvase